MADTSPEDGRTLLASKIKQLIKVDKLEAIVGRTVKVGMNLC